MSDAPISIDELAAALDLAHEGAAAYLASLPGRLVRAPGADAAAESFGGPLPERGVGAEAALRELLARAPEAAIASAGGRFFHYVVGGVTPAALGAEWLAAALDQVAAGWITSPLATQLELVSLRWLKELFGLPAEWSGVMTTGATMANFTCLAAARQWWGEQHGADVAQRGLAGLPPVPVLSSGYLHASSVKALAMLGIGREAARRLTRDEVGRLDLGALERELAALGGAPAIVVANAGEVNAGDFDPIADMANLAARHGAWLHVDGAFGMFARASPRVAHLAAGVERAQSATVDGHKWLNVPYDCGFAFVRDAVPLARTHALVADYLPAPDDPRPYFSNLSPESSRRARSLAVWATLRAYGRDGVRAMVEGHLDLAQRLAGAIDAAPDLARLADAPLDIVCFRYDPGGRSEDELDELNTRLGAALLEDGRVHAGTTRYAGRVALRPAIVNWRTRAEDVDLLVRVVRELGVQLSAAR